MNENSTIIRPVCQEEVGRPSLLNDKLLRDIQVKIEEGKNYKEICQELDISYGTFVDWKYSNYQGFSDKLTIYEQNFLIKKTDENLKYFVDKLDTMNKDGSQNARLLKIKADMTQFVKETLHKDTYSKRTETTGANGNPLQVNVTKYEIPPLKETVEVEYKTEESQ